MSENFNDSVPRFRQDLAEYHIARERETFLRAKRKSARHKSPPLNRGDLVGWVARTFSVDPARTRCREMVLEYWEKIKDDEEKRKAWELDRMKHFERILDEPALRLPEAAPPKHALDDELVGLDGSGMPVMVEGWVPEHLLNIQKPIADGPFPLTIPEPLRLSGCYTALAIVYDEKVDPQEPLMTFTEHQDRDAFRWYSRQRNALDNLKSTDLPPLEAIRQRVEVDLERIGTKANRKPNSSSSSLPPKQPERIAPLIAALKNPKNKGKSEIEVAMALVDDDEGKAKSLLAQYRTYKKKLRAHQSEQS